MGSAWAIDEQELLAAARMGDEDAYRRLVEPRRAELHAHCYRMLGSVHDAEDALQDALLRAWRALPRFERRSSIRAWLYRIATNACLDLISKRSKQRVLPIDYGPSSDPHEGPGPPLVETVWIEPYPDDPEAGYEQRESVELAFIAALQHLPPLQRAVLILREVLGFSAREVADALDTTVASVNSALQRARNAVDDRLPEASQQATLRALGDEELRAIVERYMDAWERGDVEAVVAMLAEDATITMPPMATWFRGDGVAVFLAEWAFSGRVYDAEGDRRVRVVQARANGQPAIGTYAWDERAGAFLPTVLQVLTFAGGRISEITGFVDPSAFPRFGLPDSLPAA
ncbi:MAG TPA: sigma-70 family RNA polymerase sigma factor [Solirubrobacteraceae bacterium]|nr:sigma-70 family RNA polymerase sigma factor [Solirubrobacteraceae bacterium]